MKKIIALLLALVLCLGMFAGCGNTEKKPDETKAPTPDDGVLRVMLIGHRLGNDSIWLLPEIAKDEGYTNMVVGMLYYSGCRLRQHVGFLTKNEPVYEYRQYDLSKDNGWQILDSFGAYYPGGIGADTSRFDTLVTMKAALEQQDWDVVVMQAGVLEAAGHSTDGDLNLADIQTIMDYANANDIDKTTKTKFGWNMTWVFPSERELISDYYQGLLYGSFADSYAMYDAICATLKDQIAANYDFAYIMPTGTAFQNGHSSYIGNGMFRDTAHASDIGRVITAYTWLCTLTGADMNQMKFAPISGRELREAPYSSTGLERTLTEVEKAVVIESVTNAIKTPYAMTQSAHTEAPAQ